MSGFRTPAMQHPMLGSDNVPMTGVEYGFQNAMRNQSYTAPGGLRPFRRTSPIQFPVNEQTDQVPTPNPTWKVPSINLPQVKMDKIVYDGKKDPATFLFRYNLQLEIAGISTGRFTCDDHWLIGHVGLSMEGSALDWYRLIKREIDVNPISWDDFQQLLLEQFSQGDTMARARDALSNCVQGRRSVVEFETEFRRLILQLGTEVSESEKMDRYYRGLSSTNAMREILSKKPSSLREMMILARDMETLDKRLKDTRNVTYSQHQSETSRFSNRSSGRSSGPTPMELGVMDVDSPEEEIKQLKLQVAQLQGQKNQKNSKGKGKSQPKLTDSEKERYWQDNLCFGCGKPGHQIRNCPKKSGNGSGVR